MVVTGWIIKARQGGVTMNPRNIKKASRQFFLLSLAVFLPTAQSAETAQSGESVYQAVCHYCHDTGIGPQLKGRQLPSVYVQHVARNGLRAMPAFRLTEISHQELANLAAFIESSTGVANEKSR